MSVVGPGAIDNSIERTGGSLDGVEDSEIITVHNPLSDDFAVRVGQSKPVNVPFPIHQDNSGRTSSVTHTDRDATQMYGLNLKNPDFQGKQHFSTTMIIKAGESLNMFGSEAQIAVRQLTNELMQREGNTKLLADPELRREAESRIILKRSSVDSLMNGTLTSPNQQVRDALNKSNEVRNEVEPEFPDLRPNTETDGSGTS